MPSSASLCLSRKSSRCHSTEKPPTLDSGPPSDKAGHPSSADRPPHLLNCLNEVVTQTVVIYLKICSVMGVLRGPGRDDAPNSTLWAPSASSRSLILRRGSYLTLLSPCALPYTMFPRWALHLVFGVARVGGEEVGFRRTREGPARDAAP